MESGTGERVLFSSLHRLVRRAQGSRHPMLRAFRLRIKKKKPTVMQSRPLPSVLVGGKKLQLAKLQQAQSNHYIAFSEPINHALPSPYCLEIGKKCSK